MTTIEDAFTEDYIRSLQWAPETPDYVRTLVAGNIRAYRDARDRDADSIADEVEAVIAASPRCPTCRQSLLGTMDVLSPETETA